MQTEIHAEKKLVCIWLDHEDQADPAVQDKLKAMYAEYKSKKYQVCVFHSGADDLSELTLSLLQYNKKKIEQNRMEKEAVGM